MSRLLGFPGFILILASLTVPAQAQTTAPIRDPNAVALASKALQALAGTTALSDVTLQANATYIAGSDEESGTATLVALGNQQSLVTLSLTNGQRQEIRNGPDGVRSGPGGVQVSLALHNCWVDAPWFFPGLILQSLSVVTTLGVTYLGVTQWNGLPAVHLQFSHVVPGQTPNMTTEIQQLSTVDLYFDPSSLLPLACDFNTHPDNDLGRNVPVEIRFEGYHALAGVQVPVRIQKFLQGALSLDLAVVSATPNSGVPATLFALSVSQTGGAE